MKRTNSISININNVSFVPFLFTFSLYS